MVLVRHHAGRAGQPASHSAAPRPAAASGPFARPLSPSVARARGVGARCSERRSRRTIFFDLLVEVVDVNGLVRRSIRHGDRGRGAADQRQAPRDEREPTLPLLKTVVPAPRESDALYLQMVSSIPEYLLVIPVHERM